MRLRVVPTLLAVAALLLTAASFFALSASNVVAGSRLGRAGGPVTANDLKPPGCGSLNLTSIVLMSGNGTVKASSALVLATPGNDTIKDKGGNNCIVGGGGRDRVNANSTDVCIVGPDPRSSYKGCVTA